MYVRNFDVLGHQEQVSVERFAQIAMIPGNLGRCLVALKKATKKELERLVNLLPKSNPVQFIVKCKLKDI